MTPSNRELKTGLYSQQRIGRVGVDGQTTSRRLRGKHSPGIESHKPQEWTRNGTQGRLDSFCCFDCRSRNCLSALEKQQWKFRPGKGSAEQILRLHSIVRGIKASRWPFGWQLRVSLVGIGDTGSLSQWIVLEILVVFL